jgi:uncharacterized protein
MSDDSSADQDGRGEGSRDEGDRGIRSPGPTRTVRCPICRKTVEQALDAAHRPFCSPRCKLIDLGRWLDEEYRISRPLTPDDHE